jgi:molybdate/tungstate transport system permease protein
LNWAPEPSAAGVPLPAPGSRAAGAALGADRLRHLSTAAALGGSLLVWVALLGPVITLFVHLSGHALASSLSAPGALDPLYTSLEAGGVTMAVLVLCGTPLAFMLARDRLPLARFWEAGLLCGLLLPPLVIGLLLVFMVGPYTPIGHFLSDLHLSATNTFAALVIAEVYESAPYYVLGAQSAFAGVGPHLEQQASLLGDRPARVMRRVTLPLAAPGLAMALAVAWARAMGAFGAVIIVAYHPFGLPLQIWTTFQEANLSVALSLAFLLLVVALPLPLAAYAWSARARR